MSFVSPRRSRLIAAITLGAIVLAVIGGCRSKRATPPSDSDDVANPLAATEHGSAGGGHTEAPFPRRLLFIQISNYAFLNPLTTRSQSGVDQTRTVALRLAQELKVPTQRNNQLFVFSDTALPEHKAMTRDTISEAYEAFFASSRAQDRIVVYFGGHAIEVDGKAYLVPMEGDRNIPKNLIPVEEFYSKLDTCPAVQKVVIWDVCRYNPEQKRKLPGSEPMTASLSKALTSAPEGVEVVTTCQPGENALELNNLSNMSGLSQYSGSAFLAALNVASDKSLLAGKTQSPSDPIPVAGLMAVVSKRVAEITSAHKGDFKQTVGYFSKKVEPKQPSQPSEIISRPQEKPKITKKTSEEIAAIAEEFRIPPLNSSQPAVNLADYPFRDEVIANYKSDVSIDDIKKNKQKYEFRNTTLNAFQTLRDVWVFKAKGGLQRRDFVATPISDGLKRDLKKELDAWGIGIAKLEEVDLALEKVAAKKKDQPKRWQAHYDFARAAVKQRLAYMNEYDKLMGDVLTETLPPLEKPMGQIGYHLVPSEKMKSKKDVQKIATDAQEAFEAIIADYKDTPWAVQAKYEMGHTLGMIWQPTNKKP